MLILQQLNLKLQTDFSVKPVFIKDLEMFNIESTSYLYVANFKDFAFHIIYK